MSRYMQVVGSAPNWIVADAVMLWVGHLYAAVSDLSLNLKHIDVRVPRRAMISLQKQVGSEFHLIL